ncbi:MAG: hypothetical protein FWD99_10145 [Oscillospiraceae bacterium]|nr:hypothetical protein [Oscillospiraceae bacterium]
MYIADFELGIEEKILTRGKSYFSDGLVVDLWSEAPNRYCAVIGGRVHYYDAEIHLSANGEILHHCCDCPYDRGEYCKHEVAVLLAIRRHLEQGTALKQRGKKRGLRASLQKKNKSELVNLLYQLAYEYDLQGYIMNRLDCNDDDHERERY